MCEDASVCCVPMRACVFTGLLGQGFDLPRMKTAVLVDTVLEVEKVSLNRRTHIHVHVRGNN